MLMLDRRNTRRVYSSTYNPRLYKSSTHQRCFSQFDRKTDCFDGNERTVRTIPRKNGVARNPAKLISGWHWQGLGRYVSPSCDGRLGRNPSITFKAVCGTQTECREAEIRQNKSRLCLPGNLVGDVERRWSNRPDLCVSRAWLKPLESSVRTDEKPECGYLAKGYAEIPSRGLVTLKGH